MLFHVFVSSRFNLKVVLAAEYYSLQFFPDFGVHHPVHNRIGGVADHECVPEHEVRGHIKYVNPKCQPCGGIDESTNEQHSSCFSSVVWPGPWDLVVCFGPLDLVVWYGPWDLVGGGINLSVNVAVEARCYPRVFSCTDFAVPLASEI